MRLREVKAVDGRLPAASTRSERCYKLTLTRIAADGWRRRRVAVAGSHAAPAWWTAVGELGANRVRALCARSDSFLCVTVISLRAEACTHVPSTCTRDAAARGADGQ